MSGADQVVLVQLTRDEVVYLACEIGACRPEDLTEEDWFSYSRERDARALATKSLRDALGLTERRGAKR